MMSTIDSLSRFVAQAPNAMAMFDREMRRLAASPRWLSDWRLTDTPAGRGDDEAFPEIGETWRAAHRRCLAGSAAESAVAERFERADGSAQWVSWDAGPWTDDDGAVGGIVIAAHDVTSFVEAQAVVRADVAGIEVRKRELADKAALLEATLESVSEGIGVFDADRRLRIANAIAAGLFEFPPSLVRAGVLYDEIVRFEAAQGFYDDGDDVEAFVAERVREFQMREPFVSTRRLRDGRTIDIRFNPMADGGGVFVLRDVTRRAEAQEKAEGLAVRLSVALEQANDNARRAEAAERRLKDAIEAIPNSFAIYDAEDRLAAWNQASLAMYPRVVDQIRIGAPYEHLLRAAYDRGHFVSGAMDRETWVRKRMERHRNPGGAIEQMTTSNRWLRIEERRLSDGGTVIIRTDVTDLKTRERELARKSAIIESVLENMGEGIAAYDAERKLLVGNSLGAELYKLPAELVRPSVPFEDIVRFAAARGDFGDVDVEDFVRDRIALFDARTPYSGVRRQVDGRVTETRFRPTPDGGGIIVIRDVTEQAAYEAELAEKTAVLEMTLRNMGEGLAAFDADRRLLVINDFALGMASFPPELTRPGVLYDDMLRALAATDESGSGDVESFVAPRVALFRAQKPFLITRRLNDGRVHETRFTPTPGGGGVFIYRDVTGRVASEAKLAEKTALLETTLQNMGEGISVYGPDLRLRAWNNSTARMFAEPAWLLQPGTSLADIIRYHASRGGYGGPADVDEVIQERSALFRTRESWSETRTLEDGREIEVQFNPAPDGGGVFVMRDVTERARQEAKLAEKTALLEAALENMGEGIVVYGPDLALLTANTVFEEMIDAPGGLIRVGVPFEEVARFLVARSGLAGDGAEADVRKRVAVFRELKPWTETRTLHSGRKVDIHFNPMPDGGGIFVLRDVTEREKAQARIREEEAKFRGLVEQNVAGIVIVGEDRTIRYCNDRYARMFGYEPAELWGRPLFDLIPEAEQLAILRGRSRLFEIGAPYQIALPVQAKDGRVVETLVNASPIVFEGRPASIAVVIDVTERNKAQRDLASAAAILAAVHDSSPDGILVVDPAARVLSANKRFSEMFDISAELLAADDDRPMLAQAADRVVDRESFQRRIQYLYDHPDESGHDELAYKDGRVIDRRTAPLETPDGECLGRLWLFRDITERRRGEDALRASEERLRMLIDEAPDAIVLYDADEGRYVAANRAAERLFGASRDDVLEHGPQRFYTERQPDARPVPETFAEHNERILAGEQLSYERRIRRPAGEERLCRVTLVPLPSKARLIRASFVDVTEQRAAEESLRASEERFRMLIEEAPDAILLYDLDQARYIGANKAAERLFGVARDEIVEHGPWPYFPAPQPDGKSLSQSFADNLARALAGEEVRHERRVRRPSGEERICRVTVVWLPSYASLFRISFVDVTEQKAAEAELLEVQRDIVSRQEAQRQRIARELHDSLGQYLAAMNIKLQLLSQTVADDAPLKAGLADLKTLTSTVGNEVSRLAWELRPTAIDDIGLETAIERFVEEWALRSGLRFDLHLDLKDRRLLQSVETTLYRVLQEAVTNVVKHARARNVGVVLKAAPEGVVMIIEDDGVGFEPDSLTRASPRLGLRGIRERLAAVHGALEIETAPGAGTTMIIRVASR